MIYQYRYLSYKISQLHVFFSGKPKLICFSVQCCLKLDYHWYFIGNIILKVIQLKENKFIENVLVFTWLCSHSWFNHLGYFLSNILKSSIADAATSLLLHRKCQVLQN